MRNLLTILCAFAALSVLAERQPFERYQTILDRQMFGPPPPDFDPTKMPSEVTKAKGGSKAEKELTQEQEKVKKAIKFSVLNVTPSGEIVVGFSDNADPKNPLHYYLKVGESQNGWTVKAADKDEATMTIEKDDIEVTLRLGGDSATDANAVSRTGAANASGRPGASAGASLFGGAHSLRERRRLREEQIRAEEAAKHAEDTAKREAAEKERAAREEEASKQREAEREEQRKQLLQIQEELRKAREAREAARAVDDAPPQDN